MLYDSNVIDILLLYDCYGAWGVGHDAWGIGHGAWTGTAEEFFLAAAVSIQAVPCVARCLTAPYCSLLFAARHSPPTAYCSLPAPSVVFDEVVRGIYSLELLLPNTPPKGTVGAKGSARPSARVSSSSDPNGLLQLFDRGKTGFLCDSYVIVVAM